MKKILLISFFMLTGILLEAQKVNVEITGANHASASGWQVLNEAYQPVSASYQFAGSDTVILVLEANRRYYFNVSFYEIFNTEAVLYEVKVDGETILSIGSVKEPGEHSFPFITGKPEDTKITGGTDANISEFPWQAYFKAGNYRCGGSIITNEWILTAAHCVKNDTGTIGVSNMSVILGTSNPYNPLEGKEYAISEVIIHEKYNNETLENDIALLKLKYPVDLKNARAIKLVSSYNVSEGATNPGVMAWVTGWGLTNTSPASLPYSLQKVQVPIVSNLTASLVYRNIPSTVIMAGYISGNKDACRGDSGGPLMVKVSDEYKLAGVVSWGSSTCSSFGAYTRVSNFGTWIRSKTGIPEEYVPQKPSGDSIICQNTAKGSYKVESLANASEYTWKLIPEEAGTIIRDSNTASVIWNQDYSGSVKIMLQVKIDNVPSEWSVLKAKLVKNTKLLTRADDAVLCALQPHSINVVAEGYNLAYEWYKDDILLPDKNKNQVTFPATQPENSGIYKARITGSCGTVFSGNMKLTVHPLTKISAVSTNGDAKLGNNFSLEVIAEGHDLSYQWEKDGKLLNNSNVPAYLFPWADANDIGLYNVKVSGTCGSEISDSMYVFIQPEEDPNGPDFLVWPTITDSKINIAPGYDDYYNLELYNSMGKILYRRTKCRYQNTLDISSLASGVYIVKLFNRNFNRSFRVIRK